MEIEEVKAENPVLISLIKSAKKIEPDEIIDHPMIVETVVVTDTIVVDSVKAVKSRKRKPRKVIVKESAIDEMMEYAVGVAVDQVSADNIIIEANEGAEAMDVKQEAKQPAKRRNYQRKYSPKFMKFGFTYAVQGNKTKPLCVVCGKILANGSMKASNLRRHLHTNHSEDKDQPIEYFKNKTPPSGPIKKHQLPPPDVNTPSKKAMKASYLASYRIAQNKKPHSAGERDTARKEILGECEEGELKMVPLSHSTVKRRIDDIAEDLKDQTIERIKNSGNYALQIDEWSDVPKCVILLVYVRYLWMGVIEEELLLAEEVQCEKPTVNDTIKVLDDFMTKNNLAWENCVGFSSDGAALHTGWQSGFVERFQGVSPSAAWTHSFIHRDLLVTEGVPDELGELLKEVVEIVNLIKIKAPDSRVFESLTLEMGTEQEDLILNTETRWVCRGKVLQRVFENRQEVHGILESKLSSLATRFLDAIWLTKLAYLADIFSHLNELNASMQGKSFSVFDHTKKVMAFKKKLALWKTRVENHRIEMFQTVSDYLEEVNYFQLNIVKTLIIDHLVQLYMKFEVYFPGDPRDDFQWVENPFTVDLNNLSLPAKFENQLIELSCDSALKTTFGAETLVSFWNTVQSTYPDLAEKAISFLLPFTTTSLCERGFAAMSAIKTKTRNRLKAGSSLRVNLSGIAPRWEDIFKKRQAQVSH